MRVMQKAYDLFTHEQMSIVDIAVELSLCAATVRRYLDQMGVPKCPMGRITRKPKEEFDPFAKFLKAAADGSVPELQEKPSTEEVVHARQEEKEKIIEAANNNMTPAEKYQAYIAGQGMRMMRDALPHLKRPTNVKELEILDNVIRRNLGLGGKGNGGKVKIDVNILNNSKASPEGAIIDIE